MPSDSDDRYRYDVFVSHAHADAPWAHALAENLRRAGLRVFLDAWEIGPGDVLVHEIDRGLRQARDGVLVVSPTALSRPWVQNEYAVLMQRAVEEGRRLIAVLIADAEMPPLLAARLYVDFRGVDGPLYEQRVRELAKALRGEKPGPPKVDGEGLVPPPGTGYVAAGALYRRLVIGDRKATLHGGDATVTGETPGLDHGGEERLWRLREAYGRRGVTERREGEPAGAADVPLVRYQREAGEALGRAFVPASVADALRADLRQAEARGVTLELGLEIAGAGLLDHPWETLCLPSAPDAPPEDALALHPRVHLYRAVPGDGPAVAWSVPGPLRVLVAIGSPEAQNTRGELLDMERELERILDAVEPARKQGSAFVRVLERGTVKAIREALEAERYHVLHLSCHAGPGVLILEDEHGQEDRVTAERLWKEAIPSGRLAPLVVLAGCSTARDVATGDAERLPGLARGLLDHGVPSVLAMRAPVSDRYATRLGAAFYAGLALSERPAPLAALARARSSVESERPRSPHPEELAEWSTPTLLLRVPKAGAAADQPLYDPTVPYEPVEPPAEPRLHRGVTRRRVGEFVGRRRDLRLILAKLRDANGTGVVIRGLGGVGKSTLAAEVAQALGRDGWLVASIVGTTAPEDVLEGLGAMLFSVAIAAKLDEQHPLRQVSVLLRRPDLDWAGRQRLLADNVLGQLPLLLLLDNFEDNLTPEGAFANPQLADFLGAWLAQPARSRLLVTCRYPVPWPADGGRAADHHLGPLSLAETRKLIWRLEGLDALTPEEQQRAYADVGGHPRTLEYLDALLRGGKARFADVARRMEGQLARRGIEDPRAWLAEQPSDLDRALAEAVTLASDDVLLGRLLDGLADTPMAKRLLAGASVYRLPVKEEALVWQVTEVPQLPVEGAKLCLTASPAGFVPAVAFPEVPTPAGFAAARAALEQAGLLTRYAVSDEGSLFYAVHRWTASALVLRSEEEEVSDAHSRAAIYWRWRSAAAARQSVGDIVIGLTEAHYHHKLAGEVNELVKVTGWLVVGSLVSYRRQEQLCQEVLEYLPSQSAMMASIANMLGLIYLNRGVYDESAEWYQKSLAILEKSSRHGSDIGIASCYQQLGMVAQYRGSYRKAIELYEKSLEIYRKAGERTGIACTYNQLGLVAFFLGSNDEALEWYRKSLALFEQLGDTIGVARVYFQQGSVFLKQGDYSTAQDLVQKSFVIFEELGDLVGISQCCVNLANLALGMGLHDKARDWCRKGLRISEGEDNQRETALLYGILGELAHASGSHQEALNWTQKSFQISVGLGDQEGIARAGSRMGVFLTERRAAEEAVSWTLRSFSIRFNLHVPEARMDLHWLGRQREQLGDARFRELVAEHAGEEAVEAVVGMLEQASTTDGGSETVDAG